MEPAVRALDALDPVGRPSGRKHATRGMPAALNGPASQPKVAIFSLSQRSLTLSTFAD